MNGLTSKRFFFLALAFLSVVAFNPAAAQSTEVVDAESNLSSTDITVEFSGLEPNQDYDIQYRKEDDSSDQPVVDDFETDGGGNAEVTFKHDPFGRNQDYDQDLADGWLYTARSTDDENPDEEVFGVTHGNMLLGLDTFDDGEQNSDVYSKEVENSDSDCSASVNENAGDKTVKLVADIVPDGFNREPCNAETTFEDPVDDDETAVVNLKGLSGEDTTADLKMGNIQSYDVSGDSYNNYKLFIEDGNAVIQKGDEVVKETSTNENNFSVSTRVTADRNTEDTGEIEIDKYSKIPQISSSAWDQPNEFNPSEDNLIFDGVVSPDASDSGLEYSNDGEDWSSTPPDGLLERLFYRVTGDGSMSFTATETSQAYQSLEVDDLEPRDNSVYTIPENESFSVEFLYDISYDEDSNADVEWTLENESEELTSSVYPGVNTPLDNRRFSENYDVEVGEYNWTVDFEDPDVGGSSSETFDFEVLDEEDATVGFDLISPEGGESVDVDDGEISFEYEVDSENSGTVDLYIPEESESDPQFSEDLGSGTTSRTVNLDVPEGEDLSWYLTYTEEDSGNVYTSQSVDFSTGEADPGDGEDDEDGLEISVPDLFFNAMEQVGFGEETAGYIAGMFLTLIFTAIGFVLAGTVGGSGSFILSITVAAVVGLFPSWVILVTVIVSAGAAAYLTIEATTGG